MENLKVGQKVYSEPMGNRARRGNTEIEEFTVSKVGRVFFYVDELPRCKFFIEDGLESTEFSANHKMHLTRAEIELKHETYAMYRRIEIYFTSPVKNLSLGKLKQIAAILEI